MEIVSGKTGSPHVTSQQFRQILEGTIGQGSCILTSGENLEPELTSNNLLKIRSGIMAHHGNVSAVKIGTYDEVTITNSFIFPDIHIYESVLKKVETTFYLFHKSPP